jgi:hypothetical protein
MSKSLGIGVVAAGCLAIAGAGGFLALRLNSAERAETAPVDTDRAGVSRPVQAVEAPAAPALETGRPAEPRRRTPAVPERREQAITPRVPKEAPEMPSLPAAPPQAPAIGPPIVAAPVEAPGAPIGLPPAPAIAEPPKSRFEELTIAEDTVIGIRLDSMVTSESAKVEDKVTARVARDVTVDGRTAIASGATLEGNVILVERGGKFKERARIGVRFTTLVVGDGTTRVPIRTDAIFRDGDSPAGEATSKIGASAVVGAILGAVIGGKQGAAIGGAAGAAGGTAAVAAGGRNAAVLAAGTPLTVRLTAPVTVLIEREPARRP